MSLKSELEEILRSNGIHLPKKDMRRVKQKLEKMQRNMIHLEIEGNAAYQCGGTRFGGAPDVPADFTWPTFRTDAINDYEVKDRPLSFLAQFNCAEVAAFDAEGLLPKKGLLSFFYELGSTRWGFDPKDAGCARVYWFEDISALSAAEFPETLDEEFRLPMVKITAGSEKSLPNWEDFSLGREGELSEDDHDNYEEICEELGVDEDELYPDNRSKLLGWPDIIQNNMTRECELVSRGYYQGDSREKIPESDKREAEQTSIENWRLLFQLDTVDHENFELMFGDCGRVYFYIRKEDLLARRFDKIWLVLQCG